MNSEKNTGAARMINRNLARFVAGAMVGLGLVAGALSAGGCNTVEGAGEDLERGGEKLQNSAQRRGAN